MKGYIDKATILSAYREKTNPDKFENIAEIVDEVLPENRSEMSRSDYYHTVYTVWNMIENEGS